MSDRADISTSVDLSPEERALTRTLDSWVARGVITREQAVDPTVQALAKESTVYAGALAGERLRVAGLAIAEQWKQAAETMAQRLRHPDEA